MRRNRRHDAAALLVGLIDRVELITRQLGYDPARFVRDASIKPFQLRQATRCIDCRGMMERGEYALYPLISTDPRGRDPIHVVCPSWWVLLATTREENDPHVVIDVANGVNGNCEHCDQSLAGQPIYGIRRLVSIFSTTKHTPWYCKSCREDPSTPTWGAV